MDNQTTIAELLENEHVAQFAAILSTAMSPKWRMRHPEVPSVRSEIEAISRIYRGLSHGFPATLQQKFISRWTDMFVSIIIADDRLRYRKEDLDWLIELLDSDPETAKMALGFIFALASNRRQFVTAAEIAAATGEGESTWRKRLASGEYINAFQLGGTWTVPVLSLRAHKIFIDPKPIEVEIVQEESEN